MKNRTSLATAAALLLATTAHARVAAPAMVRLPAGSYVAGSSPSETGAAHYPALLAAREQPARRVNIARPFAMERTEVTRGEFARFVKATGWKPDGPCAHLIDGPANTWTASASRDWQHPGFAQTDRHPVVCVNLADAEGYAEWLSRKTGRHFRLPSNTEWEYAARAGTTGARWWDGSKQQDVCRNASVSGIERQKAHNNGVADPNKFFGCGDGLYLYRPGRGRSGPIPGACTTCSVTFGNGTADCLNADQTGAAPDASARIGDCASHMDRGGSWTNSPKYVRSAAQHPDLIGARNTVLGFRLVEDLQ